MRRGRGRGRGRGMNYLDDFNGNIQGNRNKIVVQDEEGDPRPSCLRIGSSSPTQIPHVLMISLQINFQFTTR